MLWLKQSTAVTLKIGPFVDDTDGKTTETGLTIAQADVRLSKNGANIAQKNESTSCTHDELGIYGCPIDTTDTATLGRLQLWVHESGALLVWHEFMVVPANVWDSLFGADKLQIHVAEYSANILTSGAIAANAIGSSELATAAVTEITNAVTAALNDPTAAAISDAVWDEATADHVTAGTMGKALADAGSDLGVGAITFTYTLTDADTSDAITSAKVWVTSDQAGNTVVASGTTDSNGQITFYLDAGTAYFWRAKSGWNFTNPDTEVVA